MMTNISGLLRRHKLAAQCFDAFECRAQVQNVAFLDDGVGRRQHRLARAGQGDGQATAVIHDLAQAAAVPNDGHDDLVDLHLTVAG